MRPSQLRTVAERRFADAEALRKTGDNERANGAMYLGGFVVECLLKARLMEEHPWLQAPLGPAAGADEQRLWSLCYRSHDLEEILEHLPQLTRELERRDRMGDGRVRMLLVLKTVCSEWTVHARYSPLSTDMATATRFLEQIKELKECLK